MVKKEYIGKYGEIAAVNYLRKKRYKLYDVNFRCRFGEIDAVMTKGKYIVFVEVKSRSSGSLASPAEFVDFSKQQKLIKTAEYFLSVNDIKLQPRFDVVEVFFEKGEIKSIKHLENAFTLL